jgi:hypothetical protein
MLKAGLLAWIVVLAWFIAATIAEGERERLALRPRRRALPAELTRR